MDIKEILAHCDHTLLKPESTWAQIKEICDDGLKYHCASVCIPAAYVREAAEYVGNQLKICTVIGFPNGYSTTNVKVFETEDAIRNGADEIDMVINIGWVKDQRWDDLLQEMKAIKASCSGRILKVIVEACLLTQEEKIKRWSPPPAPSISRPPPASPPAAPPGRTWPSSSSMWAPASRSRPPAASPPSRTPRTSWPWGPTAWAPPGSSSW